MNGFFLICQIVLFEKIIFPTVLRQASERCIAKQHHVNQLLLFLLLQVLMLTDGNAENFLCQRLPVLASMSQLGGVATAYVCQDFTCSLPVTDPQELRRLLLDGTLDMQPEWLRDWLTVVISKKTANIRPPASLLLSVFFASKSDFATSQCLDCWYPTMRLSSPAHSRSVIFISKAS